VLLWVAASLLLVGLWFKVFKQSVHKTLVGRGSAQFIGEVGMITEAVAPFHNGKVRFQKPLMGSESWECVADEAIAAGARVKIVQVEGSLVTVASV
jgi:membrane protein implicated in regulation of membrane protease activity